MIRSLINKNSKKLKHVKMQERQPQEPSPKVIKDGFLVLETV